MGGERGGGICSGQFLTSKRDRDTWHAREYNKKTTAIRPSTVCLRHPNLRLGTHELGSNPNSSGPTSPLV